MVKTNSGLVEYCRAQLGKPYWYGTYGQTATEKLYREKKKQYPSYYTASNFTQQLGQRVHDCIGLIKGYLWSDSPTSRPEYNPKQDIGANAMLAICPEKGKISTIPDIPGVLVFMDNHVGVYVGDGKVIEARGHSYGVVETKLSARPWKYWGKCPWITYEVKEEKSVIIVYKTLKYGDTGNQVRTVQRLLKALDCPGADGKPLIVDGVIGANTLAAIKRYQKKMSLEADGIVGRLTWAALTGGEPK